AHRRTCHPFVVSSALSSAIIATYWYRATSGSRLSFCLNAVRKLLLAGRSSDTSQLPVVYFTSSAVLPKAVSTSDVFRPKPMSGMLGPTNWLYCCRHLIASPVEKKPARAPDSLA